MTRYEDWRDLPSNYQHAERYLHSATFSSPKEDMHHMRYHSAQLKGETAAKRLARASGLTVVKCGCGQEFPA